MKSRTIEIIDNHIKVLEEEIEWYQQKNRKWQEKCEKLEKPELFDKYPVQFMFLGKPINYWQTMQSFSEAEGMDKLIEEALTLRQENARLREQLRWRSVDELPRTEVEKLWTVNVLMELEDEDEVVIAYYSLKSNCWYNYRNSDVLEVNDKSRWCYIPDDNQGTDCT